MRTVGEAMTKTVVTAPEQAPFKELVRVLREYRVSALPIVDAQGAIVGVVSEADLLLKEAPKTSRRTSSRARSAERSATRPRGRSPVT